MKKRKFKQLTWITGAGHAAQTTDLERISGNLRKLEIKVSSVTANPTVDVTISDITDSSFVTELLSFSTLDDGTLHIYHSRSKEFDADKDIDEIFFDLNDLRLSVDPSADAGGAGQTLAVDVYMYFD